MKNVFTSNWYIHRVCLSSISTKSKMAKKLVEMGKNVQKQTAKICFGCKHALSSSRVYCGKLRRYVDDVAYCSHFESEPLEYKLYRRI